MDIEMKDKFSMQNCGADDVLSFGSAMIKVNKLGKEVENLLNEYNLGEQLSKSFGSQNLQIKVGQGQKNQNYRILYDNWFGDGIDCEILRLGAERWKKGKVRMKLRVSIEFCPDEPEVEETAPSNEIPQPESPLDDIRQMMNQENQQS
jgi:hypothetical protein